MGDCECHGDVYCSDCGATLATAERSRDEWRAKWEHLETHRAVCCDQMERERDEARAERDAATKEEDRAKFNLDKAAEQIDALKAKLAEAESTIASLRAIEAMHAQAKDSGGSGAAPCQHRKTRCENDLDVCVACGAKRMHFWGDQDDSTAVPLGPPLPPPRVDSADLTAEPLTPADLDTLEERIVERVARAVDKAVERHTLSNGTRLAETRPLASLADELRRKP